MSFFKSFFEIYDTSHKETAVCCPFDHATISGITYKETRPSAHVNLEERLFHCKVCGTGLNEVLFAQRTLGCSLGTAMRITRAFESCEDIIAWQDQPALPEEATQKALSFGISKETLSELMVKSRMGRELIFPVLIHDKLIDLRTYDPATKPKVRSRIGGINGLIIPYDIWRTSPPTRWTLVCAGEKDMAVARSHGFNAITIVGGEGTLPVLTTAFADRKVAIVYDNDGPGKAGALKLAEFLSPICKELKNVTNFHEVCCNDKEDITDFFTKYHKTTSDLKAYLSATPIYTPTETHEHPPVVNLIEAVKPSNVGKMLCSNIQVVATSEASFIIPKTLIAEKTRESSDDTEGSMAKGQMREWTLEDRNLQDVLHLMDNNFKEEDVDKHCRSLLGIMQKERNIRMQKLNKETVFKCYVTDLFETTNTEYVPMEFTAYTIGLKLESGCKYMVTYKLVPHPYKGQQLTMLITGAIQANDSVSNFQVTPEVQEHLKVISQLPGTVSERMLEITERFKGLLGYNGNNQLIQAMDLAYHTVLQFDFGTFKNIRGYLDTMIVGESRVGKSSAAEAMRKTYALGVFTSLAGTAATIPGLIGGSNKTATGAFQTRAGLIPQNHKGLIIFEEFGKSQSNIAMELTDIRSSNEVRITRVSGTISLPAMVRMITLTNPKTVDGVIKPITSYPNGIAVLTELVGTAEDIARYDLMLVLGDPGNAQIDPFWTPKDPFPLEAYRARVRWIWSRTPQQVLIGPEAGTAIVTHANELNTVYNCHLKIFGTEAWKKIARLSIAIAGYLISTDTTFENIVVTPEHVSYAVELLTKLYDNPVFKLREYVEHERKFSEIDDAGVDNLQDLYIMNPGLLLHLEQCATTTKNTLTAATGLNNDQYNMIMNRLVSGMFIKFSKYEMIPTTRFRLGMAKINRNTRVLRVGEK